MSKTKKIPEKWTITLWDTTTPKMTTDKKLFKREYGSPASMKRALTALWRSYPTARLAVVSHFKFTGLFWICDSDGTTKIERP